MFLYLNRAYHSLSGTFYTWISQDPDPSMTQTVPPFPVVQYSDFVVLSKFGEAERKVYCRVATTGNIPSFTGGAPNVVDGITLVFGDRVMAWRQTTGSESAVYRVTVVGTGANGTWVRDSDFASSAEIFAGQTFYIQEGTSNNQTRITLTTPGTIVPGVTSLTFIQEAPLVRTDQSSTVIISTTAFTNGTIIWSSVLDMRDHQEVSLWFNPITLGSNTQVDLYTQWSDDGITIPWTDTTGIQQTDFLLTTGTDGTFKPKDYTARLTTTVPAELVAGTVKLLSFPKKGGSMRFGVKGNNGSGSFNVRAQRLS